METHSRMPLHDLPLEQFLTPGIVTGNKTPRKHKRPLSPSRTTSLNPAKRRVLDAEGALLSNMRTVTPNIPSRLGNELARNYQAASSPLSSRKCSPPREHFPKSTIESSAGPQSRHYPGFDNVRDGARCRGSPVPRVPSPFDSDVQVDRSGEDKENIPVRRRARKQCPKKRLLSALDGTDSSCPGASAQMNRVVRPDWTSFSARQALR